MDREREDRERVMMRLEEEELEATARSRIAQRKKEEREAKKHYGRDWKKWLSWAKVNKESLTTLHGDFSGLRDYNDPWK